MLPIKSFCNDGEKDAQWCTSLLEQLTQHVALSLSLSPSFSHTHPCAHAHYFSLCLFINHSGSLLFLISGILVHEHSSHSDFSLSLSSLSLLISLQAISKKTSFFFPISEKASVRKKPLVRKLELQPRASNLPHLKKFTCFCFKTDHCVLWRVFFCPLNCMTSESFVNFCFLKELSKR